MNKEMTVQEIADLNVVSALIKLEKVKEIILTVRANASRARLQSVYLLADEIKTISHDAQFKGGK